MESECVDIIHRRPSLKFFILSLALFSPLLLNVEEEEVRWNFSMHDDEVIDSKSVKRNEEEKKSIARGGNLTKAEDLSGALQLLCCSECGSSEGDNKWPNISDLLGRKDEKKRLRGENIAKVYEANILLLKSQ